MSTTPTADLYALNEHLSNFLADRGITLPDDALDDLTHEVDAAIIAKLYGSKAAPEPEPEPEERTLVLTIPVYALPGKMPNAFALAEGIASNLGEVWFESYDDDDGDGDGYWVDRTWAARFDDEPTTPEV